MALPPISRTHVPQESSLSSVSGAALLTVVASYVVCKLAEIANCRHSGSLIPIPTCDYFGEVVVAPLILIASGGAYFALTSVVHRTLRWRQAPINS
jgi:hypothetical protein